MIHNRNTFRLLYKHFLVLKLKMALYEAPKRFDFTNDLIIFNCKYLIYNVELDCEFIQGVPLPTKSGSSLIILPLMRILHNN
jgi:hypothetical protein